MKVRLAIACILLSGVSYLSAQNNIVEEVAWVVGDEPIYKSEIEEQYMQMQHERAVIDGNPYCVIPERLAIEKLFLHQAKIDTVVVQDAMVMQQADSRINYFIANLGSKEKVEEYFRKPIPELREQMIDLIRNQYTIQEVQRNLTKNVKPTPADVRKFYMSLSEDSIPFVPMQVEVQMIKLNPVIPQQEIDDVKARLRDYANRVNSGESEFSTLAILYSEDGSSVHGGELGFMGKSELVPEYASVAFNLNDPKKVSKIVETEYGYHIIQLIEKRGDRVNTRHIILRPKVSDKDLMDAVNRLDSLKQDIDAKKFTFEDATQYVSQDKDSRNNKGIMVNSKNGVSSTKFQMGELPQEIAKVVDTLAVSQISEPFIMRDPKTQREVVVLIKLSNRIEGHKANLKDDYQTIKDLYEERMKNSIIDNWIVKKQKETFVRIEDGWKNCEFKYDGWVKK
ncbi:MAG: peptidylprolyl isomerase [Muribaculaceae bacterium]|nr:peptidylprolyl isomerase [Muribaculaceae bacterium]MEE1297848.1 peptidylprolyl isomerase [Muribaculaceae bacterium]